MIEIKTFSVKFKLLWGLASFGTALISGVYGALLIIFYQDYMGLKSSWITLAATLYAIWNAINDPLFGFISDSSKSKGGRRIPFMKFTAPFLALSFIAVWLVPPSSTDIIKFIWMIVSMLLYDSAYTIIGLVYSALLPELTESDAERGSLQTYASVFALVGMILGFLIPDYFRAGITENDYSSLYIGVIMVGIAGAICIIVTAFNTKERLEFTKVDTPLGLWDSIKFTFKSKSFLILTAANFMSIFMQSIVIGSLFYLADYVLQVSTIVVLVAVFLGLLLGVFFANMFAKKLGVVKAQQLLLILAGVCLCLVSFVPDILIYFCLFVAGFGLSGPQVLTNILFAQVADEDEVNSGVRREAMFFGVNALITKPAQSVALAIVPIILEATNFVTRSENNGEIYLNQTDEAIFGIKSFLGLLPGIAILIGALILQFYPLKGEYLKEIQQKTLKMHTEKKSKLDKM